MFKVFALIAAAGLAAAAPTQTTPGSTGTGGLAGVLGGVLPRVGSIGAGNAAGLLGYCLKNNLLGTTAPTGAASGLFGGATPVPGVTPTPAASATGASAILGQLLNRPGVEQSPGYKAGEAGQVQTGNGRKLGLDGVQGQLRTQMCKLVLNRAKSFL